MSFIDWQEEFLTGVKEFDLQHKKIINMINALYEGIRFNIEKEVLKNSLEALRKYLEVHFKTEEEFLEKHGYPEIKVHKEEHKKFFENFERLINQENINYVEVLKFFKNWWVSHLLNYDKRYGLYLKDRL